MAVKVSAGRAKAEHDDAARVARATGPGPCARSWRSPRKPGATAPATLDPWGAPRLPDGEPGPEARPLRASHPSIPTMNRP